HAIGGHETLNDGEASLLKSEGGVHRERIRGSRRARAGTRISSGGSLTTAAIVSVKSWPGNARIPVNISNSTHPNAQISARLSTVLPRACSGAMYAAVPRSVPTPVIIAGDVMVGDIDMLADVVAVGSIAFARPKSSTLTTPSGRTLIFAGFRSRWM